MTECKTWLLKVKRWRSIFTTIFPVPNCWFPSSCRQGAQWSTSTPLLLLKPLKCKAGSFYFLYRLLPWKFPYSQLPTLLKLILTIWTFIKRITSLFKYNNYRFPKQRHKAPYSVPNSFIVFHLEINCYQCRPWMPALNWENKISLAKNLVWLDGATPWRCETISLHFSFLPPATGKWPVLHVVRKAKCNTFSKHKAQNTIFTQIIDTPALSSDGGSLNGRKGKRETQKVE